MTVDDGDGVLQHIGIARRSGRYPWGSGDTPQQRSRDFKYYMDEMTSKGLTKAQIGKLLTDYANEGYEGRDLVKISSADVQAGVAIATAHIRAENVARAQRLKNDRQMSNVAIAEQMGTNESTVRGWLKNSEDVKEGSLRATADVLKEQLSNKPFLDVGKGTELYLGISDHKLRTALSMLRDEGYQVHHPKVPQLGTDKDTRLRILTKAEVTGRRVWEAVKNDEIQNVTAYSDDGGASYKNPAGNPVSVNLKRVDVRYKEDGGATMDGVIELRRGVPDISLGDKSYAQVRIAVDGTHYLKGMAMYADDLPPGVDMRFNTNKTKAEAPNKIDTMKPLKTDLDGNIDPRNAFGATTYPKVYVDRDGKEKTSPLNIVNEEGAWDNWSKSLSSQMLSKQSISLASKQLGVTQAQKKEALDEINALTNPVVKKKLLEEFADSADAAAVHLKAAALKGQSSHVILPMNSMRTTEIYAPNFNTGDKVVLIRYPHGGPFEIPSLTVNNNNAKAKRIIGGAKDAVGIHHKVAEQLSGADFDGDAVLVIPNPSGKIKTQSPLKELETFEPRVTYAEVPGMKYMTKKNTQREMGNISNLITDMTIHKAPTSEIVRAVKHSMVVIDAEKHKLNYKQSALDNNITQLKKDYQGGATRGAATLISKASATKYIRQRKPLSGDQGIDPVTGRRLYRETGASYDKTVDVVNRRTGEVIGTKTVTEFNKTRTTKMDFVNDANELLGPNAQPIEKVYASHANAMKALANRARLDSLSVVTPRHSAAAKAIYAKEVESLEKKLKIAQMNAPVERRAQIMGNNIAQNRIDANPDLDKDDIKKIRFQSLDEARTRTGAAKIRIGAPDPNGKSTLTDREWEAIQAGAIPKTKLNEILANADMERVKALATPRTRTALTPGQLMRARQMEMSGRPMSEIAEALGLPRSTISENLKNA